MDDGMDIQIGDTIRAIVQGGPKDGEEVEGSVIRLDGRDFFIQDGHNEWFILRGDILEHNKSTVRPRRNVTMEISIKPPDPDVHKPVITDFLNRVLDHPLFYGPSKPLAIRGYLWINGAPRLLSDGSWQIGADAIYLSRPSEHVDQFTKLSIITGIASFTGVLEGNLELVQKISTRLTGLIRDHTQVVHSLMVSSTVKPSKLAVNQSTCQVAANINDGWFLPGGAPVEVDESWIIMDF